MGNRSSAETETVSRDRRNLREFLENEHDWTAGFKNVPKSKAQARLAFAARDHLESLPCFDEITMMMLCGDFNTRIADHIIELGADELKRSSLAKYVGVYRRFFVGMPRTSEPASLSTDVELLPEPNSISADLASTRVSEVHFLEGLLQLQRERLKLFAAAPQDGRSRELMNREVREARETAARLVSMKLKLGLYVKSNQSEPVSAPQLRISDLTREQHERLIEFGVFVKEAVEAVIG